MAAPTGDPAGYELAYEAGKQAIAEQATVLRETRDRAGALMSAAAIAAGLGVGLAFDDSRVDRVTGLAVGGAVAAALGFLMVTVAAVVIWWPSTGRFVHDAGIIVGDYVEGDPPAKLPEVHRELALHLGRQHRENRDLLDRHLRWFSRGLAAFLVEVLGLLTILGDVAHG